MTISAWLFTFTKFSHRSSPTYSTYGISILQPPVKAQITSMLKDLRKSEEKLPGKQCLESVETSRQPEGELETEEEAYQRDHSHLGPIWSLGSKIRLGGWGRQKGRGSAAPREGRCLRRLSSARRAPSPGFCARSPRPQAPAPRAAAPPQPGCRDARPTWSILGITFRRPPIWKRNRL